MCLPRYNTGAHLRECWNGRQARLRCVWSTPCGFESHLSHQKEHHPKGWCSFWFCARDGARKSGTPVGRANKCPGDTCLARGRVPQKQDASVRMWIVFEQFCTILIFELPILLLHSFPHSPKNGHNYQPAGSFLQVLAASYINLILFATIFYQLCSIFSVFLFYILRHNTRFSNFLAYVMHTLHRFFHRF